MKKFIPTLADGYVAIDKIVSIDYTEKTERDNPQTLCIWNVIDSNNITHEVMEYEAKGFDIVDRHKQAKEALFSKYGLKL